MTQKLFSISRFFLYLAPFSLVIVYQGSLFPFIVGKYFFFRTVVELALLFFLWGWALAPQKRSLRDKESSSGSSLSAVFKNPLVIAVGIFVAVYLLAGFFGVNPQSSFWSNFERGEGGLQLLHFFAYFFLLAALFRDAQSWRRMLVVCVAAALLLVGYGLLASLKYVDAAYDAQGNLNPKGSGAWFKTFSDFIGGDLCGRFSGSLGNPAYVGTVMLFAIFYSLFLLVSGRQRSRFIWGVLAFVFFLFLLLSQTRGAFLGLGAGVVVGLAYLAFRANSRRWRLLSFAFLLFFLAVGGALVYNQTSLNVMPWCEQRSQVLDVSVKAQTFQTRLTLWRQSIEAFKERPWLGWGPENFSLAIEKHFDLALSAAWFDRAHNIFFDYLVFTGLLGLLSFIAIFIVLFWRLLRSFAGSGRSLAEEALLVALPVAYLVQGLVLFDVLSIYLNLFLFLAFCFYKINERNPI